LSTFFGRAGTGASLVGELLGCGFGITRLERAGNAVIGGAGRFASLVERRLLGVGSDGLGDLVTNVLTA